MARTPSVSLALSSAAAIAGMAAKAAAPPATEIVIPTRVMAGHSRSQNGVASLAFVPAIHVFTADKKDVDARHKAGHDE